MLSIFFLNLVFPKDIYCFAIYNIEVVPTLETDQQNAKIAPNSKKNIAVIAVAVLIIAVAAALVASGLLIPSQNPSATPTNNSNSQTSSQNSSQSWIKIGTYATYEGQVTVLSMTVNFNARMEIVDLNATHFQILTTFNMSTPYGDTENTTTTWVRRENMTFQPDGLTLNNTYTTQITLPNLGTRSCTVYQYDSQGISAAYYIDNSIQWPIKMVMSSPTSVDGQSYNMDINLVDTNISGL